MTPLTRYVVETLVTLLAVAALVVLLLSVLRRAGVGRPSGPLELVARLPLDGRRAVYLVRAGEKVYVLAAADGALQKLGELEPDAVTAPKPAPPVTFADTLRQALGRRPAKSPAEVAEAGRGDP